MNKIPENAPQSGFVIAYLKEQLVFAPYEIRNSKLLIDGFDCTDFTAAEECHFFDCDREYRRIFRSARGDMIDSVLTAKEEQSMDPDLVYMEEVLVKPEYAEKAGMPSKLTIINRYRYSEHDTLVLDDYRISCSKQE